MKTTSTKNNLTPRISVITMGCSKNLVDSERLMGMLEGCGAAVGHDETIPSRHADILVINTCGFIGDAKEESVNMILMAAEAKKHGRVDKLIVMGCLSERYRTELAAEIPEIDQIYGKYDWTTLAADHLLKKHPGRTAYERVITTPRHHAYVKIAEGCNRMCAFCAIPLITGRLHSRPIEEIVDEVSALVARGTKEINLIAQELTGYGTDIYGEQAIGRLVDAIAAVKGVRWIRLHYAYPNAFPQALIDAMARNKNVCRYLDIALQHCNDKVLANMQRHTTRSEIEDLIRRLREGIPGIHLRTTLMVGFPGEGEQEFAELEDFVRQQRFERMGAFAYCEEEGTAAARRFADDIPAEVKQQRLDRIMDIQEGISLDHNLAKVGSILPVVVDSREGEYYRCRTEFDSPEVDPEVLIPVADGPLRVGQFYQAEIVKAMPYELIARIAK